MKKTAMLIGLAAVLGFSSNAQAVDWNWKGDLRYRYQSKVKDQNTATEDARSDAHRIRLRFGSEMWINEELSAGLGVSTADLSTSRNQDLTDGFAAKDLYLDQAYLNYHPMFLNGDVNLIMGKRSTSKVLTVMDDLIWDGDVTIEGITLQYGKDASGKEKDGLAANAGLYFYDDGTDATILAAQASYKGEVSELGYQAGASYYNYLGYTQAGLADATNATDKVVDPAGLDYNIIELFGNVSGKVSSLPWKVYAQYACNTAKHSEYSNIQDDDRNAYLVGLKLGKAKNPGQLEGSLEYYYIEDDAVNPNMSDSDRGDALGTKSHNLKGWKLSTKYALINNMDLGLTYFYDQYINPATPAQANDRGNLLQADVVVKF